MRNKKAGKGSKMAKINPKTHRKFERAAGMKFVEIYHKGHWGNVAECTDEKGDVWDVNKKTGEVAVIRKP